MTHSPVVSSLLRIDRIRLNNFRCFEKLDLCLDSQVNVVVAENAGGKTALLNGLAVGLGAVFNPAKRSILSGDVREVAVQHVLSPQFPCTVETQASVAGAPVSWTRSVTEPGGRTSKGGSAALREAVARIWTAPANDSGANWPVVAFYGTQRLWSAFKATERKAPVAGRRPDGYTDALDPRSKEAQLVDWIFKSTAARLQLTPQPGFEALVQAIQRASVHPGPNGWLSVESIDYDMAAGEPTLRLSDQSKVPWSRMSDGYHIFLAMVADLARRCVTLNPHLGARAVEEAQGVVLIDEVDLHLHPRWQRVVIPRLLEAFPRLQFVVSSHSPQVLGSVGNHQVIRLTPAGATVGEIKVEGRDTNAILRDVMGTDDRPDDASNELHRFFRLIDLRKLVEARTLLDQLTEKWGESDPTIIDAKSHLEREENAADPEG